jgi:hypothetical protein
MFVVELLLISYPWKYSSKDESIDECQDDQDIRKHQQRSRRHMSAILACLSYLVWPEVDIMTYLARWPMPRDSSLLMLHTSAISMLRSCVVIRWLVMQINQIYVFSFVSFFRLLSQCHSKTFDSVDENILTFCYAKVQTENKDQKTEAKLYL